MSREYAIASTNVMTFAEQEPGAGCVRIVDNRIAEVTRREELENRSGSPLRVLDAGDRPVLPGFIDAHAHVEVAARVLYTHADVRAPRCGSVADVLDGLRDGLGRHRFDGWLLAQGNLFMDRKLKEGRLPTREELDSVSTDTAIALRAGGHITVLNTRALEEMGLGAGYQPPSGSITGKTVVEKDASGRPTGVIKEMDNLLPSPVLSTQDVRSAMRDGVARMFTRNGVTTIGEISETPDGLRAMGQLARTGELTSRIQVYLWTPGTVKWNEVKGVATWARDSNIDTVPGLFDIRGVKVFADGGYSAANAAVKRPFHVGGKCSMGELALSPEELLHVMELARNAGLQLAVHANGDRAQEVVCDTIASAGGSPGGAVQIRVEHAGNFLPDYEETVASWKRAGILPSPQPVFIYAFGDYFPDYLGDYGELGRFPFRRLLQEGWDLPASSDVWVGSEESVTNPFFGMWCSVGRQGFRGQPIDIDQRISVEQALRMYTVNGAKVFGKGDELGSLEPGKLADVIVLSEDPLQASLERLKQIEVDYVFRGGELVYERPGAKPLQEITV